MGSELLFVSLLPPPNGPWWTLEYYLKGEVSHAWNLPGPLRLIQSSICTQKTPSVILRFTENLSQFYIIFRAPYHSLIISTLVSLLFFFLYAKVVCINWSRSQTFELYQRFEANVTKRQYVESSYKSMRKPWIKLTGKNGEEAEQTILQKRCR